MQDNKNKYFTKDKVVNKRINSFIDNYFMKDKGNFFWKKRWFSICTHIFYQKECDNCNIGRWENVWKKTTIEVISVLSPKLWNLVNKYKTTEINIKKNDEPKKYYRRGKK
jgi:hypothetical protein